MTQFHNSVPAIPTTPSQAPAVQEQANQQPNQQIIQEPADQEVADQDANVTPEAKYPHLRGSKARVEFRDEHGNVLDESLVSALRKEGKVSFETRYETKTRLAHGHQVDIVDGQVAPAHPDVEGQNPETVNDQGKQFADDSPASAAGGEKSVEKEESQEAKPASEGNEATKA